MKVEKAVGGQICLFVDPARIYRWHLWLAEALRQRGDKVMLLQAKGEAGAAFSGDMMLRLERKIYRMSGEQAFDLLSPEEAQALPVAGDGETDQRGGFDIVINFTAGNETPPPAARTLRPLFDGVGGDLGAYAALLEGRNVEIRVEDTALADSCWTARPAVEEKRVVARALNNIFSRAVELLLHVVKGRGAQSMITPLDELSPLSAAPGGKVLAALAAAHVTRELSGKLSRRIVRMARVSVGERWATAWRFVDGPGLFDEGGAASAVYNLVPDDGRRYFADPFVFRKDGRTYIFCEEYPYDTEKGVISVFELGDDGALSAPKLVLERPCHLSYPHLFERDGEIWMIPEAGAGGNVELFRAVSFPDQWRLEKVLIKGVAGYDATITEHEGRMWMFLSTESRQSTSWDNLLIYHADSLLGEWLPHDKNPVLVDGYVSRPGGEMIRRKEQLLRPAQDGSQMYGGGLNLCRVDRLDGKDFSQTVIGAMTADPASGAYGVHTINRVGNVEVVDILGAMPPDCQQVTVDYRPVETKKA